MSSKYFLTAAISAVFLLTSILISGCSQDGNDSAKDEVVYYCPMHPEVISDKPGVCPICHMDLVLRDKEGDDLSEHLEEGLNLSASKLLTANVSTAAVISGIITQSVKAYSYLDFAEQSRKYITARFNGRIEKLLVNKTGEYINKGEPLFEVYSPDLIQAQNDYLLSLGTTGTKSFLQGKENINNMHEASRQKLLLMGISEEQIKKLETSKETMMTLTYHSPFSGVIIDKKVQDGMYINEGALIYEVADLSLLWNIAEVYEQDLQGIKQGADMKLTLDAYPGEIFEGRVDLIYPVVNSGSRTVKIRSVVPNKKGLLKPNMYGQALFESKGKKGLLIPEGAVLFTGNKTIVWVEKEPGSFESREIEVGIKGSDNYEVVSGLKEGEVVAATGGFLIDSESQLRSGNTGVHDDHSGDKKDEPVPEPKKENEHQGHSNLETINESLTAEIWNTVCPVIGGEVDPGVKTVTYKNKVIGFCCSGCDEDFETDPEKYLSNLNENGTKYISLK